MDWRSHFTATWFAEWEAAQLAGPGAHVKAYDALRRSITTPERLVPQFEPAGALRETTVSDVYTFGHLIGRLVGQLLSLPDEVTAARADWCGRFNLGISLFDYVADENGRADDLVRLPPFAGLQSDLSARPSRAPHTPVANALATVADDVLKRLHHAVGAPDRAGADPIWGQLREMMQAELLMSRSRGAVNGEPIAIRRAAQTKSAGPFACMAEFMSLGAGGGDSRREAARTLGAAIGDCFWFVDDAADLWEDFDSGRWNVFLLQAAAVDAGAAAYPPDAMTEVRLSRVLVSRGWLRHEVVPIVQRLKTALVEMPADQEMRLLVSGLFATAMSRWLQPAS